MSTHSLPEHEHDTGDSVATNYPATEVGVSDVIDTPLPALFVQTEGTITGTVTEALPDTKFRVECKNSKGDLQPVIAYLSGRMRLHRIRVVVGDSVEVLLDGYVGNKGRITRRY